MRCSRRERSTICLSTRGNSRIPLRTGLSLPLLRIGFLKFNGTYVSKACLLLCMYVVGCMYFSKWSTSQFYPTRLLILLIFRKLLICLLCYSLLWIRHGTTAWDPLAWDYGTSTVTKQVIESTLTFVHVQQYTYVSILT